MRDLEMATVYVYGQPYEVPKVLSDELTRLMALERQSREEDNERRLREWEAKYGSLPEPPTDPQWIEYVR